MKRCNIFRIMTTLVFLLVAFSCKKRTENLSSIQSAGRPSGAMRGLFLMNQHLRSRLIDPNDPGYYTFSISSFVDKNYVPMETYLGQYDSRDAFRNFSGSRPSPLSLGFWYGLLNRFAGNVSSLCANPNPPIVKGQTDQITLNEQAQQTFLSICTWSEDPIVQKKAASDLWQLLALYPNQIPTGDGQSLPHEGETFVKFATEIYGAEAPGAVAPAARLQDYVVAILMNPQVQLEL